jgi:hypothetical protein
VIDVIGTSSIVMRNAKHVSIDAENIKALSEQIAGQLCHMSPTSWLPRDLSFSNSVFMLLIYNSVNYCFWNLPNSKKWSVSIDNKDIGGSMGLLACFNRVRNEHNFFEPSFWANIDENSAAGIFSKDIPMFNERVVCLRNVGAVISKKYGGINEFINMYHNDAMDYVTGLSEHFDAFSDYSNYDGVGRVYFLKRAQLFASMLNGWLLVNGYGGLKRVDELSAFADYRVPQVLRHYGVLCYDTGLANKIENMHLLCKDSVEEIEIRAATIVAVEKIKECIKKMGKLTSSADIDSILWNASQHVKHHALPCHMTYTTAY